MLWTKESFKKSAHDAANSYVDSLVEDVASDPNGFDTGLAFLAGIEWMAKYIKNFVESEDIHLVE